MRELESDERELGVLDEEEDDDELEELGVLAGSDEPELDEPDELEPDDDDPELGLPPLRGTAV